MRKIYGKGLTKKKYSLKIKEGGFLLTTTKAKKKKS